MFNPRVKLALNLNPTLERALAKQIMITIRIKIKIKNKVLSMLWDRSADGLIESYVTPPDSD